MRSLPVDTLVVGDSRIDQILAKNCGSDFAFFSGGYDDGVETEASMLTIHHHPEIFNLFPSIEKGPHRE
jgi:phosphoglycolate phosphatase-like HAD superfamily hydrolase